MHDAVPLFHTTTSEPLGVANQAAGSAIAARVDVVESCVVLCAAVQRTKRLARCPEVKRRARVIISMLKGVFSNLRTTAPKSLRAV